MRIAVPKETMEGERRVALVPDAAAGLVKSGFEVVVQAGAGEAALFFDDQYRTAGASVETAPGDVYGGADIALKVQRPLQLDGGGHEADMLERDAVVIGLLQPLAEPELAERLASLNVTSFSLDAVPRIARAQSMDALSSMASIAGYKAALIAASLMGKYLPMMITAAGSIPPAKGLVLGAGVAGLQAIATARRMGAVMSAFDVRPAVEEQVKSLGATFIYADAVVAESEHETGYAKEFTEETQRRERELLHESTTGMDFVISSAAVPGKPAPVLISEEMVHDMKPGAVIVDIAAETGGNCALTKPGEQVTVGGVIIDGPLNLPSSMPTHASQLYSRNISNLLLHLVQDGELALDFDDVITKGCCVTHDGKVVFGAE